jgi:hypothetical protein
MHRHHINQYGQDDSLGQKENAVTDVLGAKNNESYEEW